MKEKELLLQDLCARLPYGIKVEVCIKDKNIKYVDNVKYDTVGTYIRLIDDEKFSVKPYLRPMSSMTEEEKKERKFFITEFEYDDYWHPGEYADYVGVGELDNYIDWLISNHFDYRGLIPMGLALEAPEGMYKEGGEK